MTVATPPVAIEDSDDPFLDELKVWFDHLFCVAATSRGNWPIVAGLTRDLNRRAKTINDMDTALHTLVDTAGLLVQLNHPGPGAFRPRINQMDSSRIHPGWIHAARAVAAAAAGDDITPFLTVTGDTQFALRVLTGTIGITITQAHQWFTRDQETTP